MAKRIHRKARGKHVKDRKIKIPAKVRHFTCMIVVEKSESLEAQSRKVCCDEKAFPFKKDETCEATDIATRSKTLQIAHFVCVAVSINSHTLY